MAIVRFRRTTSSLAALRSTHHRPKKWALFARIPWKKIIIVLAVVVPCVLVSGGTYALLWSPYFTIDFIDVHNDQGVDATRIRSIIFDQMERPRLGVIPQKSIAAFSEDEARKKIWDEYALDRLTIEKKWPHSISVTIEGTPFAVAWLGGGKWYHLDAKGGVAREVDPAVLPPLAGRLLTTDRFSELKDAKPADADPKKNGSGKPSDVAANPAVNMGNGVNLDVKDTAMIPLMMDTEKKSVRPGDRVMPQEKVDFVTAVASRLVSDAGVKPLYFKTTQTAVEVYAVTDEGWEVILNSHDDAGVQVKNLSKVLQEQIKDKRPKLKYVDVRFGNRVFYKL